MTIKTLFVMMILTLFMGLSLVVVTIIKFQRMSDYHSCKEAIRLDGNRAYPGDHQLCDLIYRGDLNERWGL